MERRERVLLAESIDVPRDEEGYRNAAWRPRAMGVEAVLTYV
jgi:hypothetical protein